MATPRSTDTAELRDGRHYGWFRVDDKIADLDLPSYAKLTYMMLCRHADAEGKSFPGINLLAAECGFSRRNVERALNCLESTNMVKRENRQNQNLSNLYTLTDKTEWTAPLRHIGASLTPYWRKPLRHIGARRATHSEGLPTEGPLTNGAPLGARDVADASKNEETRKLPTPTVHATSEGSEKGLKGGDRERGQPPVLAHPRRVLPGEISKEDADEVIALFFFTILTGKTANGTDQIKSYRAIADLAKDGISLAQTKAAILAYPKKEGSYQGGQFVDERGKRIISVGFLPFLVRAFVEEERKAEAAQEKRLADEKALREKREKEKKACVANPPLKTLSEMVNQRGLTAPSQPILKPALSPNYTEVDKEKAAREKLGEAGRHELSTRLKAWAKGADSWPETPSEYRTLQPFPTAVALLAELAEEARRRQEKTAEGEKIAA